MSNPIGDPRGSVTNYLDSADHYGPALDAIKAYISATPIGPVSVHHYAGFCGLNYSVMHVSGDQDTVEATIDAATKQLYMLHVRAPSGITRFAFPEMLPL